MKPLLHLLTFILPAVLCADLPIRYWTPSDSVNQLALSCQDSDGGRIILMDTDGDALLEGCYMGNPEAQAAGVDLLQMQTTGIPASPWWNSGQAERLQEEEASATALPKLELTAKASSWHIDLSTSDTPNGTTLIAFAETVALPTIDPLVQLSGIHCLTPDHRPLESALHAALLTHARAHLQTLRANEAERTDLADRPSSATHELRLLHLSNKRCAALILTRSSRRGASTSIDIAALNLELREGQWQAVDPLTKVADPVALREAIRTQLNRVDADGDTFATQYPNPLLPDARSTFSVLRFEQRLWFIFEPYVVAAGAYGTIAIPVHLSHLTHSNLNHL